MPVISPAHVLKKIKQYRNLKYRCYLVLLLNLNKKVTKIIDYQYQKQEEIKLGNLFIPALYLNAKFIIIVSFKPNRGSLIPKKFELKLQQKAVSAGKFLGITLLDYLIVNKKGYYSFHESGLT